MRISDWISDVSSSDLKGDGGRGTWVAVVTQIPFQVQKSKLIEQIAALINDRKLPILADVRDESDELIRIVIEPRDRTVDPDVLMDSLFRLTDLENSFPLHLNGLRSEKRRVGESCVSMLR